MTMKQNYKGIKMANEMSPLDMAKTVLEMANTGLHIREIAEKAIAGGLATGIDTELLAKKINAALAASVQRDGSPFAKVTNPKDKTKFRKGVYRLKRVINKPAPAVDPDTPQTEDTGFIGKAGEHAVMSELLFLGFNVSLMSVDKGVDIVAANASDKYFHIQVKTATHRDDAYYASVSRKSFDANKSAFYVFVLRKQGRNDYMIIPGTQISIYEGNVVRGASSLSFKFGYDAKTKKYTLNGVQDASLFTNKWSLIR